MASFRKGEFLHKNCAMIKIRRTRNLLCCEYGRWEWWGNFLTEDMEETVSPSAPVESLATAGDSLAIRPQKVCFVKKDVPEVALHVKQTLDKEIGQWLIDAAIPFAVVDRGSFRRMMHTACPDFKVVTRNTQKSAVLHDTDLHKSVWWLFLVRPNLFELLLDSLMLSHFFFLFFLLSFWFYATKSKFFRVFSLSQNFSYLS